MAIDMINGVTKGQVLRYMFMPQILPRLYGFAQSGFSNLAFMIAMVYRSLGLIPFEHAIFHPDNRAHLTLRNVIGTAAAQLKFTWSDADKIIVFFSILLGLVLLALQFVSIIVYLMVNPALAGTMPTTYGEFFTNPHQNDIAYMLLYSVFGVPELFRPGGSRSDFHVAIHDLFQFYSIGLLVVAVIITCYFIFAVVVETAQTGVPFGKRYKHTWAPLRFVVALGLLIPVGYGLNSAQWITLYSAKLGSDFATTGWVKYNETMGQAFLENTEERVGTPKVPNIKPLTGFMAVALACKTTYEHLNPMNSPVSSRDIQAYVISESNSTTIGAPPTLGGYSLPNDVVTRRDLLIRFGIYDPEKFTNEKGKVHSYCGDLTIHFSDVKEEGSRAIQESYLKLVENIWNGSYGIKLNASRLAMEKIPNPLSLGDYDPSYRGTAINEINKYISDEIDKAVTLMGQSATWQKDEAGIRERGWGGAGIWYNKIAQLNGALVTAVNSTPQARAMPFVMENVKAKSLQQNREGVDMFGGRMAGGYEIQISNTEEKEIAPALAAVYESWSKDPSFGDLSNQTQITGNFFIDAINVIFGTQGLFAMCQNTDVHPLAQLSQLGKGLVEASIRNLAIGIGLSGLAIIPVQGLGAISGAAASILMSVAGITIIMGFLLYYVLPFMPFLYFFFAVGGWIKGLFEAMVGVPLWALAFLRIDGEGLPGDAGMTGFYLILEIFLRPIMIIFGLLASIVIFAAMVKILNEVFYLVVQNVSGHDPNSTAMCGAGNSGGSSMDGGSPRTGMDFFRGPVDELFFTILYAIVVYMIGMSCFKLIDLVPNNILRYMGASVNTFNDRASDPADGLMMRLSIGGKVVSDKVIGQGGILNNLTATMGHGAKAAQQVASQ